MDRRSFLGLSAVVPTASLIKPDWMSIRGFLAKLGLTTAYSFIGDGVSSPYQIVYKIVDKDGYSLYSNSYYIVLENIAIDYNKPGIIYPKVGKIFALNNKCPDNIDYISRRDTDRLFECRSKTVSPGARHGIYCNVRRIWENKRPIVQDKFGTVYCDSLEVIREIPREWIYET